MRALHPDAGPAQDPFFLDPRTPDLYQALRERVDQLLQDPAPVRYLLRRGYEQHLARAQRNRTLLRTFVQRQGWEAACGTSARRSGRMGNWKVCGNGFSRLTVCSNGFSRFPPSWVKVDWQTWICS